MLGPPPGRVPASKTGREAKYRAITPHAVPLPPNMPQAPADLGKYPETRRYRGGTRTAPGFEPDT